MRSTTSTKKTGIIHNRSVQSKVTLVVQNHFDENIKTEIISNYHFSVTTK